MERTLGKKLMGKGNSLGQKMTVSRRAHGKKMSAGKAVNRLVGFRGALGIPDDRFFHVNQMPERNLT